MKKIIILVTIFTAIIACKSKSTTNQGDSSTTVRSDSSSDKSDSANKDKVQSDKKIEDSVSTPAPASGMGDKVPNSSKSGN